MKEKVGGFTGGIHMGVVAIVVRGVYVGLYVCVCERERGREVNKAVCERDSRKVYR